MEWDSSIFPTCASRANFRFRVCRFTSRKADSATPLVACSPIGLLRKTNSTSGEATKTIKLQITIVYGHQRVLLLPTRLPSLLSFSDPTCSHASITPSSMLGMSRCDMVFDFNLGWSTSDDKNIGSLFIIIHILVFQ